MGSGETSPAGRKTHDYLLSRLPRRATVAVLETPAGFQPNVELVAGKIVEFFRHSLRNYEPRAYVVQARKRGTGFDPDHLGIAHYVLAADYIFAGPGSPTYTARQLRDTRTLHNLQLRHRQGATVCFASAAALAVGSWTLPVYEIYKSGEELRWEPGLDILGPFGLDLAVVTHWNNREGGRELDTSRCYVGQERFDQLRAMLPAATTILGIDEQVACIIDLAEESCEVVGPGGVTVMRDGRTVIHPAGERFPLAELRGAWD